LLIISHNIMYAPKNLKIIDIFLNSRFRSVHLFE
jgi:hypothetical protein